MRKLALDLCESISQIVLDKEIEIQVVLTGILSGGHLLIEDHPGVGKTTLVQCFSKILQLPFARIQFTSDMLPADILGNSIFNNQTHSFDFHPGPIFSNLVLGDELNRANPRTQSALLQALEEKSVTIDGKSFDLPSPFIFIATQNPKTQIGTFSLPESQLDRFMISLKLDYASRESEIKIIQGLDPRKRLSNLQPLITATDLAKIQNEVEDIHISEKLAEYISNILESTRNSKFPGFPLSIRAGLMLAQAARSWAWINNRQYCTPDDIKFLSPYVLGHRLFPDQGILAGHELIKELLNETPIF